MNSGHLNKVQFRMTDFLGPEKSALFTGAISALTPVTLTIIEILEKQAHPKAKSQQIFIEE